MISNSTRQTQLIRFLQEELAVPASAIALALRQADPDQNWLPIVLWQYGLITLQQLDQVFEWMETA